MSGWRPNRRPGPDGPRRAARWRAPAAVAVLAALCAPVARPAPAWAAFPGKSGSIAFMRGLDILVMHPDGNRVTSLTEGDDVDEQPVWSPTGTRIVFARQSGTGRLHLFVMTAYGTDVRRLTSGTHDDFDPTWSPDGSRIAFVRGAEANDLRIMVVRSDGTGARRIATGHSPAWSPDGRWIAFNRVAGGKGAIFLAHPDGTGLHRLTPSTVWADYPSWSPAGNWLAFTIIREALVSSDIAVIGRDGNGMRRVTRHHEGADQEPAWSPGGGRIAFVRITGDGSGQIVERIHIVEANTTTTGAAPGPGKRGTQPDWRPRCTVVGTAGDDVLRGTAGRDLFCAGAGDDRIRGQGGNDVVFAGPGDDTVEGLSGSDVLVGGPGADRLAGGFGPDLLQAQDGAGGNDRIDGGPGSDVCRRDRGDAIVACP